MSKAEEEKSVEATADGKGVVIHNNNLVTLLSRSASTVSKVERLLDKVLEDKRVAENPEMLLRIHKQTTEYNISLLRAVSGLMEASKGKDGKIQKLTDEVIGAVEGAASGAVGGTAPKGRIGRVMS